MSKGTQQKQKISHTHTYTQLHTSHAEEERERETNVQRKRERDIGYVMSISVCESRRHISYKQRISAKPSIWRCIF